MHEQEMLSAEDVAQELRCSRGHVYRLIRGQVCGVALLPAVTLGRKKVVRRAALEDWKRRNESGSPADFGESATGHL